MFAWRCQKQIRTELQYQSDPCLHKLFFSSISYFARNAVFKHILPLYCRFTAATYSQQSNGKVVVEADLWLQLWGKLQLLQHALLIRVLGFWRILLCSNCGLSASVSIRGNSHLVQLPERIRSIKWVRSECQCGQVLSSCCMVLKAWIQYQKLNFLFCFISTSL